MATSFDAVIDLALVTVDDYKLLKLINQSQEGFDKWCDGFLIRAIPNFFDCRQSLEYDVTLRVFISDLTPLEISILADFWVMEWARREIDNSAQLQLKLQVSSAFTTHSPSQNTKEKLNLMDEMREKVHQKIVSYQLQNVDPNTDW